MLTAEGRYCMLVHCRLAGDEGDSSGFRKVSLSSTFL